jgi:hypothetical protein
MTEPNDGLHELIGDEIVMDVRNGTSGDVCPDAKQLHS